MTQYAEWLVYEMSISRNGDMKLINQLSIGSVLKNKFTGSVHMVTEIHDMNDVGRVWYVSNHTRGYLLSTDLHNYMEVKP